MKRVISSQKNWFVLSAAKFQLTIVKSMEKILLNSSVDSAVLLLNGFVGVVLIFVSHATKDNVKVTMSQNMLKINFQNVLVKISVL